ncbi:hypothetical protein DSO57_1017543 [Entomophthora muscae]|uniref:Uncharacterized protein n=1 Tax=Entomophthora muscae TaxID=34485 RepID=A0ACC2U349_9FUNG|nr:hypothetical protein DSO57_1017543 [Entomophthora muscae]
MSSILSRACSKGTQLILFPIRCVYSTWVFPVKVVYDLYTSLSSPTPPQLPTFPEPNLRSNVVSPMKCKPLATSPAHPIRRGSEPTLCSNTIPPMECNPPYPPPPPRSNSIPTMECKPLATSNVHPIFHGTKPTLQSNAVPHTECKPLTTSHVHPIFHGSEPTFHSNTVPNKRCKPLTTFPVHPIRRKVCRRSIGTKARIEQALAHEDTPTFVSQLNLAL